MSNDLKEAMLLEAGFRAFWGSDYPERFPNAMPIFRKIYVLNAALRCAKSDIQQNARMEKTASECRELIGKILTAQAK